LRPELELRHSNQVACELPLAESHPLKVGKHAVGPVDPTLPGLRTVKQIMQ